ncbi:MAG: MATE family efflux transporter [Planctomycetes bacterium]|nr:MATE family efflux transporter [Planctomycetota bacterium]
MRDRSWRTAAPQSPAREVFRIALPAALGLLSYAVMHAVDYALLGHYHTVDQAGVGITAMAVWALMCPVLGTMSALATFSAQYTGAGRYFRAGRHLRSALLVAMILSIPYLFLSLAAPAIVDLFRTDPAVASAGSAYLRIRLLGVPLVAMSMGVAAFLRGTGDAVTPLKISLAANVLNLGLDWVLIFGRLGLPALGVRGAALATVAAQAFEAACCLYLLLSNGGLRRDFRFGLRGRIHWVEVRRLVRVGGPVGAYWAVEAGAWAVFMVLLGRRFPDQAVVAANGAAFQVWHLSFLPVVGLLIAAQALVGRYVGARDPTTARRRGFLCMRMGVVFMTVMGVLILAFRDPILGLFTRDPAVIELGGAMLFWVALAQPFDAMGMTAIGALRGAGDTVFAFWAMAVVAWLVFLPATWLITCVWNGAAPAAWIGGLIYVVFLALLTVARLRGRAWETKRV